MSTKSPGVNMPLTVALITMDYRGRTQHFCTISQTVHCLSGDALKAGGCCKITVDFALVAAGDVWQVQPLHGQPFVSIELLQHLDRDTTRLHAKYSVA
jgi:hypothetical protein